MRLISQAATVVAIGVVLLYHGVLFAEEDDTQLIRTFIDLSWKRGRLSPEEPQPILEWVRWCKIGLQLGEFEICPPR